MVDTPLSERLLKAVEILGPGQQERVLSFAHGLATTSSEGVSGRELAKLAGCISKEDAEEMMRIIEEDCERVEQSGW